MTPCWNPAPDHDGPRHTRASRRASARVRLLHDVPGRRSARPVAPAYAWTDEDRAHLAEPDHEHPVIGAPRSDVAMSLTPAELLDAKYADAVDMTPTQAQLDAYWARENARQNAYGLRPTDATQPHWICHAPGVNPLAPCGTRNGVAAKVCHRCGAGRDRRAEGT